MTRSCVALVLVGWLLGCDGGGAPAPMGAAGGRGGMTGADAGATGGKAGAMDAAAGPVRVTLTNVTVPGGYRLLWVAFNDGEGPWQTVDASGSEYQFQVTRGRYGMAFVCEAFGGSASGEVVNATVAELPALTVDCSAEPVTQLRRISGRITGSPPGASVELQLGTPSHTVTVARLDPPVMAYQTSVPPDTYDLAAVASVGGRPRAVVVRRELAVTADLMADLDFTQEAALVETPLALVGDGAMAMVIPGIRLFTGRGIFLAVDSAAQAPRSYLALPPSALQPGESQELELVAVTGQMPAFSLRGAIRGFREPRALELSLPPEFASAQVTAAATTPTLRPRMTFTAYPNALYYQLSVAQFSGTRAVSWLAIVSAAWLGEATSYDFPDLSGARGFDPRFVFMAGGTYDYSCDAVTSSRDFSRTINGDGATRDGSSMTYARKASQGPIR